MDSTIEFSDRIVLNLTNRSSIILTPHLKDFKYFPLLLQCIPESYVIKLTNINQTVKIILQVGVVCHQVHCSLYHASKVKMDWLPCPYTQS